MPIMMVLSIYEKDKHDSLSALKIYNLLVISLSLSPLIKKPHKYVVR